MLRISRLFQRNGGRLAARPLLFFTATLLLIEFLDELAFNVQGAAMPRIRDDLGLSYAQIGLLAALPGIVASVIEPALGVLGDLWRRKALIVGGGLAIALAISWWSNTGTESAAAPRHVPSVRAHELYLEALSLRSRRDIETSSQARAKLEAAIKEDPEYAQAWAALADANSAAVIRQLTKRAEGVAAARAAYIRTCQI